ncbi:MAG: V-type ATP synthase subunit A, partial [Firmicutes bacterium]|nr:V-type ATP synthase subunit A [Bacillota bacterium]
FYERAGMVEVLGKEEKKAGSVTVIGAVSPPGGDLSEPVSQGTLRITKVFLGLSAALAYKRHFPAIDWLISYSLYADKMEEWYTENISSMFLQNRTQTIKLLQESSNLEEIVRLVGMDSLSDRDKLILETSKHIKEDFLYQHAFSDVDSYCSKEKQFKMLNAIMEYFRLAEAKINNGARFASTQHADLKERLSRMADVEEENIGELDKLAIDIGKRLG